MVYLVSSFYKSNNIGGNGALVVFFFLLYSDLDSHLF